MQVEGNTDAWPDFSKLDSIWREALLEPVLECAAGNECDIFLAHPLVLSRMRHPSLCVHIAFCLMHLCAFLQ